MTHHDIAQLGRGFYWQEIQIGQRFQTFKRTITETDIINFISVTGMLESIFIDKTFERGAIQGRPAPGALTYGIIEGFIMQGMVQGTGLALLEVHKKVLAPVVEGDTIWADIEITYVRPTSTGNRAVVNSRVDVKKNEGTDVMTYTALRLLAGDPKKED